MRRTILLAITWVVILHVIVLLTHSIAHFGLGVLPPTILDYLFVGVVIAILPIVALFMAYKPQLARWGALLLLLAMLGSLVYGLSYHFLIPGIDNVAHHGAEPWHSLFVITSYALFVLEAAGVVVGAWGLLVKREVSVSR